MCPQSIEESLPSCPRHAQASLHRSSASAPILNLCEADHHHYQVSSPSQMLTISYPMIKPRLPVISHSLSGKIQYTLNKDGGNFEKSS